MPVNEDGSVVLLGSEDDIAFVKKYPLIRALFCLNTCIQLRINGVTGDDAKNEEDNNCIESARVSLAYVWLELNNPTAALKETEAVIQASNNEKDKMDRNGRLAIARAYAHEAARTLR
jgi:Tfp pilus assembly protein PilF